MKSFSIYKSLIIFLCLLGTSSHARVLELSATVISNNEKIITSRYMGFVKSVRVSEGQRVKKNELLYEIDSSDIDSKKEQALLHVQIYSNQFLNVKLNHERYKRLYKKGLVSRFDLEQIELNYNNLKNTIAIAKISLKEINNQYKYLQIKAPNDGIIIEKNIKTGEMAIPGSPAFILSDLSALKIQAEITESDLKDIYLQQEATIFIPSLEYESKAKVSAIIPSSNPMTHTFTIKIDFLSNEKIYPGMYAKVRLKIKE